MRKSEAAAATAVTAEERKQQQQKNLLVDKVEGVGDVVVAQVHDRRADPRAERGLRRLEQLGHRPADARGRLDLLCGEERERERKRGEFFFCLRVSRKNKKEKVFEKKQLLTLCRPCPVSVSL